MVNFNLVPEFAVVAMRAMFLVIVDHYVDDFMVFDLASGEATARFVVEEFFLMLGRGAPRRPLHSMQSPEIDPEKTKPTGEINTVLGVGTTLRLRPRSRTARTAAPSTPGCRPVPRTPSSSPLPT